MDVCKVMKLLVSFQYTLLNTSSFLTQVGHVTLKKLHVTIREQQVNQDKRETGHLIGC